MKMNDTILGLDIGTTKVCAILGKIKESNELEITGVGIHPSEGLASGEVVDMEVTTRSIQSAIAKAQNLAGVQVGTGWVGMAGSYISSYNRSGSVAVSSAGRGVTAEDIRRAQNIAIDRSLPKDFEVIHTLPRRYRVDDNNDIKKPLGMLGSVLEVDLHLIAGRKTALRNIERSAMRAGMEVVGLVLEPLASSMAVLTESEKRSGVAVIDIGGGTTDLVVYREGKVIFSEVILVGGDLITQDIAHCFGTPFENAEQLKIQYGYALESMADPNEPVPVARFRNRVPATIKRQQLAWVIEARIDQILKQVQKCLHQDDMLDALPAGVVLTGGTALLEGLREKCMETLHCEVQIGFPHGISGYREVVSSPVYATAIGLLHYGLSPSRNTARHSRWSPVYGAQRLWNWAREAL
jgi:cell division protein FtsA